MIFAKSDPLPPRRSAPWPSDATEKPVKTEAGASRSFIVLFEDIPHGRNLVVERLHLVRPAADADVALDANHSVRV